MNTSIDTALFDLSTDILIMDTVIDSSFFFLNTTINEIGNNITENFLLLNNTVNLVGNEIGISELAILNNLAIVNNSISEMITAIETDVYLINNSIYNAIVALDTSLTVQDNDIMGNLTIMLGMNEYLTQLYQTTMFSSLINWTDAYRNATFIEEQINTWDFINLYKDQALEIEFYYLGVTEKIILDSQATVSHILPSMNVNYRVTSLASGDELQGWDSLDNTTVKLEFGFYDEDIQIEDIEIFKSDLLYIIITGALLFLGIIFLMVFVKRAKAKQWSPPSSSSPSRKRKLPKKAGYMSKGDLYYDMDG